MVANAMTESKSKVHPLMIYLDQRKNKIAEVLPRTMSPDRMMKIAFAAASRNPTLLKCVPESFYMALHSAAQLGLEPNTPLGQAYLIPYYNKNTQSTECQFQIGYKGMLTLLRRSGELQNIFAYAIRKGDEFEVTYGLNPNLIHKPRIGEIDPAGLDITHVYAVAKFKDGATQFAVMTRGEVEAIRRRSKAASSGPWVTDWEPMALKTVLKRLCKYLPLTIELADAIDRDNQPEINSPEIRPIVGVVIDDDVIPGQLPEPETQQPIDSKSNLKEKIKNKRGSKKKTSEAKEEVKPEPIKEPEPEKTKGKSTPKAKNKTESEVKEETNNEPVSKMQQTIQKVSDFVDQIEEAEDSDRGTMCVHLLNQCAPHMSAADKKYCLEGMEECIDNPDELAEYDTQSLIEFSHKVLEIIKALYEKK